MAASVAKMLENCANFDPDIKYTGAHDLCNVMIASPDQLEESLEKRICSAFMDHLTVKHSDVKSNAVRCI